MYMHYLARLIYRLATSSSFDSFLFSVIIWNRHISSWTNFNWYSRHFPGIESVYWWEGKVHFYLYFPDQDNLRCLLFIHHFHHEHLSMGCLTILLQK
jgi:hypothetical protein